jgi:hypothetical protein
MEAVEDEAVAMMLLGFKNSGLHEGFKPIQNFSSSTEGLLVHPVAQRASSLHHEREDEEKEKDNEKGPC